MPAASNLKPTIYFRGGYWRIREPIPRPYHLPPADLWHAAHRYIARLNQYRRV